MSTSDHRQEASAGDGPAHPRLQAALLMAGIVLLLVVMSLASVR